MPAIVLSVLVFNACKKEEEEPTPSTPEDVRQKFVADWTCTEVSRRDPPATPFGVHGQLGSSDTLLLENFSAIGFSYKAKTVVVNDSIFLRPNNQQIGSVFVLSGKGKWINANKFTMTYVIDDAMPVKDTIDATFTK